MDADSLHSDMDFSLSDLRALRAMLEMCAFLSQSGDAHFLLLLFLHRIDASLRQSKCRFAVRGIAEEIDRKSI